MRKPNSGKSAAQASWVAPILLFFIGRLVFHDDLDQATAIAITVIQVILMPIGFGAAIYALMSIRRFNWRGILIPATIGLILNAGYLTLLGIFLYAFATQRA